MFNLGFAAKITENWDKILPSYCLLYLFFIMYLCLYIVNRLVKLQINHLQNLKKKKVKYYILTTETLKCSFTLKTF